MQSINKWDIGIHEDAYEMPGNASSQQGRGYGILCYKSDIQQPK